MDTITTAEDWLIEEPGRHLHINVRLQAGALIFVVVMYTNGNRVDFSDSTCEVLGATLAEAIEEAVSKYTEQFGK